MPNETWSPIAGFEGLYDISDQGRIRTYRRQERGRYIACVSPQGFLSLCHDGNGYVTVVLKKDGRAFPRRPHRLVLEAFVGPCPPGCEACHQDGDKKNNFLSNLRWDTHRNNQMVDGRKHGTCRMGLPGELNHAARLTEEKVREIRSLAAAGMTHVQIAKNMGLIRRNVSRVIHGDRWAHVK